MAASTLAGHRGAGRVGQGVLQRSICSPHYLASCVFIKMNLFVLPRL